jgi:hypothetical protein
MFAFYWRRLLYNFGLRVFYPTDTAVETRKTGESNWYGNRKWLIFRVLPELTFSQFWSVLSRVYIQLTASKGNTLPVPKHSRLSDLSRLFPYMHDHPSIMSSTDLGDIQTVMDTVLSQPVGSTFASVQEALDVLRASSLDFGAPLPRQISTRVDGESDKTVEITIDGVTYARDGPKYAWYAAHRRVVMTHLLATVTCVHLYQHAVEEETRAVVGTLPPDHAVARLFDAFSVGAGLTNALAYYQAFENTPSLAQSAFNLAPAGVNILTQMQWKTLERTWSPLTVVTCSLEGKMRDLIVPFVDKYVRINGGDACVDPDLLEQFRQIPIYANVSGVGEVLQMHLMACVLHSFQHTALDHMFTSPFFQPKLSQLPTDLADIQTEQALVQSLVLYAGQRVSVGNTPQFTANLSTYLHLPAERGLVNEFTRCVRRVEENALSDPAIYIRPVDGNSFMLPGFVR